MNAPLCMPHFHLHSGDDRLCGRRGAVVFIAHAVSVSFGAIHAAQHERLDAARDHGIVRGVASTEATPAVADDCCLNATPLAQNLPQSGSRRISHRLGRGANGHLPSSLDVGKIRRTESRLPHLLCQLAQRFVPLLKRVPVDQWLVVICIERDLPPPITERPRAPSGVAAFMSAHSKTPCITPSMDFYSGKGVVRGRRVQQLGFALPARESNCCCRAPA
jgi:hypothetical protein